MDKVRFGIAGLGNMGNHHLNYFNSLEGAALTALCDADPARMEKAAKGAGEIERHGTYESLLNSKAIDAILIATPHYQHGEIARAAFAKGIHVLCEKPVAVSVSDARRTNEAAARAAGVKFSVMFQERTKAIYQKMRELVLEGELGEISRVTWIVTDWFRGWAYYASGGWRATWKGEGGGVLLNQCPHNLDLIQWITGMMPSRITAVGFIGKTHPIETEDEISAILEYPNGAIGHFITTTGEAPGTNRLEIAGDRGKLICEGGKITFARTRKSVREVREKSPDMWAKVETWTFEVPLATGKPEGHKAMTQNFINAILKGEPLLGPGEEGIRGLELGNAMLMAGLTRTPVELPIDGERYDLFIEELAAKYGGRKTLESRKAMSEGGMGTSFAKG